MRLRDLFEDWRLLLVLLFIVLWAAGSVYLLYLVEA